MNKEYEKLYNEAVKISENAYAPYSGFKVGAAILTEEGKVYKGVNIENASYGATICAERSAVCTAITDGKRRFKAIAIYSPNGASWPCGICRQVLWEFSPNMNVIARNDLGEPELIKLEELLVNGFKLEREE